MVWTASQLHICMLSFCCSPIEHVIVASVDACSKMVQRFPRWPFSRVARWDRVVLWFRQAVLYYGWEWSDDLPTAAVYLPRRSVNGCTVNLTPPSRSALDDVKGGSRRWSWGTNQGTEVPQWGPGPGEAPTGGLRAESPRSWRIFKNTQPEI